MTRTRLSAGLVVLILASLSCNTLFPPKPEAKWDPSPESVVVEALRGEGLVPYVYRLNMLPAARVWGDGRIVWTEFDAGGRRRVLEGRLTPEALAAIVQKSIDAGFFGWRDQYAPSRIYDAPNSCLSLTLADASKTVCEMLSGAPAGFDRLFAELAGGAAASGTDFVPARGYLTAHPEADTGQPPSQVDLRWPADALGFSLAEAAGGAWVEGETLALAWQVVNAKRWAYVVQDGAASYQLSLQIPGLSQIAPPAP